jgi:hypothetical protein
MVNAGDIGHVNLIVFGVFPVALSVVTAATGRIASPQRVCAVNSNMGINGNPVHVFQVHKLGFPISLSPSFWPKRVMTVNAPYVLHEIKNVHPKPIAATYGVPVRTSISKKFSSVILTLLLWIM